ncbi:ribonuclease D [Hymenobacter properus]|uniref:HRDC domain-containing protein n=1 Tax=Hymenobacter properus TaxID=2791026 RepID=A0A931FKW3_9BACT|nr:HRDC domain-containing protein [Hymenobacter properus]MBF9142155.1 HRDC domain-containing protein [Hymenobacter properus]MBR7720962.1 HRDC domain-containing protein [Microvirga sp. SRT04]
MPTIHYLTTAEAVVSAAAHFATLPRIGIDLEFDDMRHRYGRHLALIQVFDGLEVYLIDPLPLPDMAAGLEPLFAVLRNPAVAKVFHSCKSDILLLDELFGVHCRNIVDTSVQFTLLAAEDNNISLGRLIQAELGFEVDKGEQKSNWLKRPLTEAQKEYAANDVLYLFELTDRLSARLAELGRSDWAAQENIALEAVRYGRDDPRPWSRNAAKYRITPQEMPIFRELYLLRDAVARQLDRPPYHVLSNDKLAELTRNPIETTLQLRTANGLHPELKRPPYAEQLLAIGTTDLAPEAPLPADQRKFPFRRRLSGPAATRAEARETLLNALKAHLAADHGTTMANMVLSNRLIADIIELGADAALRPWQQQLLRESAERHGESYEQIAAPFQS